MTLLTSLAYLFYFILINTRYKFALMINGLRTTIREECANPRVKTISPEPNFWITRFGVRKLIMSLSK